LILGTHHTLSSSTNRRLTSEIVHLALTFNSGYKISAFGIEVVSFLSDFLDIESSSESSPVPRW
jgi:hypothetical protein